MVRSAISLSRRRRASLCFTNYIETYFKLIVNRFSPGESAIPSRPGLEFCWWPTTTRGHRRSVSHHLLPSAGRERTWVAGVTNDQCATDGTEVVFGTVASGFSVGTDNIQLIDARVRGGGLAPQYQNIPQAVNFWDLGHLDGKPYPLGGTSVVLLPASILNTFADADVQAIVAGLMPMGTLAVVG